VADPLVAGLIAKALAGHQRYRIAANKNQRQQAALGARDALAALLEARTLNPSRSDEAWKQGTPRTRVVLSDRMIDHFVRYVERAALQGY